MKPLVLLHGFTGAPQSFDELHQLVRSSVGALRSYRPTILGHGAQALQVQTFEGELDRLAGAIGSEDLTGAHLCGYSMGARLALGLVARHSNLFSGATLIGVHPGLATSTEKSERRVSDERWCRLLENQGLDAFMRSWQDQPTFETQARLDEPRAAAALSLQHVIRSSHDAGELARALRVLGLAEMPDYRAALATTSLPLTLVVGSRDAKFLALARAIADHSSSAELEIVQGAGHNVVLEAPARIAELLARAMTA